MLRLVFLGVLFDGESFHLCIPEEKRLKALSLVQMMENKNKATVKELQKLTGLLNFLCKVIHPGRTFTRRMYNKYSAPVDKKDQKLKHFHHMKMDTEFKRDCRVWQLFLQSVESMCLTRPFIDFESNSYTFNADIIGFYTDASTSKILGFGCYFNKQWTFGQWEQNYIKYCNPSIEHLELYALLVGIFVWKEKLRNGCFVIFYDNESVVQMVNSGVSFCHNCMYLLRMLTLNNLLFNKRIFVCHKTSKNNFLADSLSRLKLKLFFQQAPPKVSPLPERLPDELWPASKLWQMNH